MHISRNHRAARRIALGAGLIAIFVATPAWAQEPGHRHDPEGHIAELREELDLTDQQVEQIRAILTEQHMKFEQLHGEEGGDRESNREAFRQLREETHQRIQTVLTEEQKNQLEEIHAEHKESHGRHCTEGGEPKDHTNT
jgi:Spy/CpxP family protein refolding chaperone